MIRVYMKGLLDQFKTRDMPRIGISVDMLDTGIDIRELVNLVLLNLFIHTPSSGRWLAVVLDCSNRQTWNLM